MNNYNKRGSAIAWIALVLAIISLVIAWFAYNRSGTDLEEQIKRNTIEATREARQQVALLEARAELLALRTQIESQENLRQAEQEVAETRRELAAAYSDASQETKQEFREIDNQLERLEQSVRNESAESIQKLEEALKLIRRDIRTDEE